MSFYVLAVIYRSLAQDEQKKAVAEYISLRMRDHFEPDQFYTARLFDLSNETQAERSKYMDYIRSIATAGRKARFLNDIDVYTDRRIDAFINYCFKFDITIPADMKTAIENLSEYYKWLLNLDTYDYKHFDGHWIDHHFTVFYKLKFRTSKKLKEAFWQFIKNHPDADLDRAFVLIYALDD